MEENIDELFTVNPVAYLKNSRVGGEFRTGAIMEGAVIMEGNSTIEAFMCLMAGFYVFHLDYPPPLKRTFAFFQMEVMEIIGKSDKKDNVMRSFWQKLQ